MTPPKPAPPPRPKLTRAIRDGLYSLMSEADEARTEREGHNDRSHPAADARQGRASEWLSKWLGWELHHGAADRRRQREALKLLDEARWRLLGELNSVGDDEVREHPTLQAYARLIRRIDRFLGKDRPR